MAPICLELKKRKIPFKICVTAQHREMLDQVLNFFEIKPDFDLNLMQPNQSLNGLSSRILSEMDQILKEDKFDLVLVHGDTTTSTMVSLAAFHLGIKVGHVEAGLRTFNKREPFPEELNRQLTGRIADIHFAPTQTAKQNLLKEGVSEHSMIVCGNTVIDALLFTIKKVNSNYISEVIKELTDKVNFSKKIILVTGHRRENFGAGIENICKALTELSKNKNLEIVYPVHLNPNVQSIVFDKLTGISNIHLIAPLEYPSFVWLMSKASIIISDSGGIQEEAPSLNIPVLVTRNTTERFEGINTGCSFIVGTNQELIIKKAIEFLNSEHKIMINPYGDGNSTGVIIDYIEKMKL